jgi:protocatechuate 3,4-dioxygenase alpha subunit
VVPQRQGSLRRDGHTFTGWGRAATDDTGRYSFTTVEPGPTDDGCAPFIAMTVLARGLLNRLFTRVYLPGREELATDSLLVSVPADRRDTLVAGRDADGLLFDVTLQGDRETVFLSYPGH